MKTKTTKRLISMMIAVIMIACTICAAVIPATASEADVRATADGVLFFGIKYDDEFYGRGSCFLINEDTIITANHCVHISQALYNYLKSEYGATKEDVDRGFSFAVTIARDFTIPVTLVNSSENMDFAILKLSQPIRNRTYLTLRDSTTVEAAEKAYSVGFPLSKDSDMITAQYYNQKDIAIEAGIINRKQYTDAFPLGEEQYVISGDVLMLTAGTFSGGNSGGPIVDADGNVIGVCSGYSSGACYASAISQVMEVLDAIDIDFEEVGGLVDEPADATEATEEIEETKAVETEPIEIATEAPKPVNEGPNWLIIAIIALVVVLIAVVVIVIIVMSKKNNGGNTPKGGTGYQAPNPMPRPAAPNAPAAPKPPVAPAGYNPQYARPAAPAPAPANDGAGETSVLNDGAGETSVLGVQSTGFTLIRKSNGQSIDINKPEFVIGKERRRVDYCIENNSSVSRAHARIKVRGGQCFIADLGSTNATFVNGSRLTPNQEVAVKKGDKIKISDEEFELA